MLSRIITRFVGWAVAVFYDVERTGPPVPGGPVLVAANHTNALIDPLLIFHTAGRTTRPLAKAPLFEHALIGVVLKGLGGLPVYRREDNAGEMRRNHQTFDAAIDALHSGGAVQIYPEGRSHSEPALTPLRTGAARISLMAEERSGWTLGLVIQPVGLTFVRKHLFRGRAVVAYGEPVRVADFRDRYEADQRAAVRALTDIIRERLEALTLNFDEPDDRAVVEAAERIYASEKGLSRPGERDPLAERLPRLQDFAAGLRWLRVEDPARAEALRLSVSRYERLVGVYGVTEGGLPRRYPALPVAAYALRHFAVLSLVLPVAGVGALFWAAPYHLTGRVVRHLRPNLDQIATYKVSVATIAFVTWLVLGAAVAWLWSWQATVAVVVLGPLSGLAAIAWHDRQSRVREDVRVFIRAARRSESRDRLAELRLGLVAEFDAIEEAKQAAG